MLMCCIWEQAAVGQRLHHNDNNKVVLGLKGHALSHCLCSPAIVPSDSRASTQSTHAAQKTRKEVGKKTDCAASSMTWPLLRSWKLRGIIKGSHSKGALSTTLSKDYDWITKFTELCIVSANPMSELSHPACRDESSAAQSRSPDKLCHASWSPVPFSLTAPWLFGSRNSLSRAGIFVGSPSIPMMKHRCWFDIEIKSLTACKDAMP